MQTTDTVFMVRPALFARNAETARSNAFQQADVRLDRRRIQTQAQEGFDRYAAALTAAGVRVWVFDDRVENETPDSLFPNNWITLHADGRVILYPMEALNRRRERNPALIAQLARHFALKEIIDLSHHELAGHYLEGTGSLVFDHVNRIAYVCRSSRSTPTAMRDLQSRLPYRVIWFDAYDRQGNRIYHTNVMMSVGIKYAVVCLAAIADGRQRLALEAALRDSGKIIMPISLQQVASFCGNILELRGQDNRPVIALSEQAWSAFDEQQRAMLSDYAAIVRAPIEIIERLGGGGARCMIAEIFCPPR
ncbi:amidinotransferase [Affinibrenneria salicis]|uniref:Amidinotransferase n=1 Tax=Affinibrenneria salicis TaxID=2590031 RepID=A0A5J5FZB9_9GAMM|nr:arginine deiminase-related protein [Affinibrenneria salicis]KAA8999373.1 amidinotransferase [Affinibrenneria salicis]